MNTSVFEKVRIENDLTKVKVCRIAQIKEPTYDAIINKKSSPRVVIIERICKALEIHPSILWAEDNSYVKEPDPNVYKKICKECEEKDRQIKDLHNSIRNLNKCLEDCIAEKKSAGPIPGKVAK
jgi:transcriptional regulator with XRE-family HTH domain